MTRCLGNASRELHLTICAGVTISQEQPKTDAVRGVTGEWAWLARTGLGEDNSKQKG